MTTAQVLSIVVTQTWQVAALASIVWLVVRYATREHSHVSHMLWTLVLIKCLTPPIWSSPVGLFSRWSPTTVLNQLSNTSRLTTENETSKLATSVVDMDSNKTPRETSIATQVSTSTGAAGSRDLRPAMIIGWLGGAAVFALVALIRFVVFLRQIQWNTISTPPEVSRCVERLRKQLRLRQKVGVRVVTSSVGPAVYGLLSPVIVLPQAIVMGKSESQLEPLVAHEMIHVRRGDLLIALIQSLACNLGWFHPMVWFASRCVTIESERCCDEETITSLQCKPSVYARSLLDVLERKHLLRVAPALPGVRPVDITSARLERIMRLGQGSRRRSPWWVWCTAVVAGIAVLPGAHYVAAQPPEPTKQHEKVAKTLTETGNQLPEQNEAKRKQMEEAAKVLNAQKSPAPFQFDAKADNEKSTLLIEVEIFEIGANSPAEKELTLWLEKQTTGSNSEAFKRNTQAKAIRGTSVVSDLGVDGEFVPGQMPEASTQDQTKIRAIPILSKIPYANRFFSGGGNSQSDGSVVQASALVAPKPLEFVTPTSEDVDSFTTSMKKFESVKSLSAPKLICKSEQAAMVSVKETDSPEPCAGFSLSLKPIELKDGGLILHYDKSTTTKTKLDSAKTAASKKSNVKLPPAYQTRQTGFSISVATGQSLVVVSKGADDDAPDEVVVVKVSKTERPQ